MTKNTTLWKKFTAWLSSRRQDKINGWRAAQNTFMRSSHSFRSTVALDEWLARSDEQVTRDQELIDVFGCGWKVIRDQWTYRDWFLTEADKLAAKMFPNA